MIAPDDSTASAPIDIDPRAIRRLLDRDAITDVLHRRARASDRRDTELARSCYHSGATEHHEGFDGPVDTFLRERSLISSESPVSVTVLWHLLSNIVIDLDGDDAVVESYHVAVVEVHSHGADATRSIIGGRYLDVFGRRDGRWAITHRTVVFDWSRVEPVDTTYWDLMGHDPARLLFGSFGPDDPLYSTLGIARGA